MSEGSGSTSKWSKIANILVPLLLTLVGSFVVLEIGLRILYQLIPIEVCASDPIIGNYYCQPYLQARAGGAGSGREPYGDGAFASCAA